MKQLVNHVKQVLQLPPAEFKAAIGRRGKPVKKLRLIHTEKAFALNSKFKGRFGTTVSVL